MRRSAIDSGTADASNALMRPVFRASTMSVNNASEPGLAPSPASAPALRNDPPGVETALLVVHRFAATQQRKDLALEVGNREVVAQTPSGPTAWRPQAPVRGHTQTSSRVERPAEMFARLQD